MNAQKSIDTLVCILGSIKQPRMETKDPVSFQSFLGMRIIQVQEKAISNVFPFSKVILTLPKTKKKLLSEVPSKISLLINEDPIGHVQNLIDVIEYFNFDRLVIIDADCVFNEQSLIQCVMSHSSTIISKHPAKNKEQLSVTGQPYLKYISYDLPYKWSGISVLAKREIEILKKIIYGIDKRRTYYQIMNELIYNHGCIRCIKNTNGFISKMEREKLCEF